MPLADARPVAMITTSDRKTAESFYAGTLGLPARATTASPPCSISPESPCG